MISLHIITHTRMTTSQTAAVQNITIKHVKAERKTYTHRERGDTQEHTVQPKHNTGTTHMHRQSTHTQRQTRTHTHSHTNSHTYSRAHTHTQRTAYTHTHTHTHIHIQYIHSI